jgi:plasmid replication initiation protein
MNSKTSKNPDTAVNVVTSDKDDQSLYVLQQNAIARAIYSCNVTTKKLIAYAMAECDRRKSDRASFTIPDFLTGIGMSKGAKTYLLCFEAMKELENLKIQIKDKNSYTSFPWFGYAQYDWSKGEFDIALNPFFVEFLHGFKGYTKLELLQLGNFHSLYAMRFHDLIKGFQYTANRAGEWFVEISLAEIKTMFDIQDKYKGRLNNFKKYVIELPIDEINALDLGYKVVKIEYKKNGRSVTAVHLSCVEETKQMRVKGKPTEEERAQERADAERKHFIAQHKAQYEECLKSEMEQPPLNPQIFGGKDYKQSPIWIESCKNEAYKDLVKLVNKK